MLKGVWSGVCLKGCGLVYAQRGVVCCAQRGVVWGVLKGVWSGVCLKGYA